MPLSGRLRPAALVSGTASFGEMLKPVVVQPEELYTHFEQVLGLADLYSRPTYTHEPQEPQISSQLAPPSLRMNSSTSMSSNLTLTSETDSQAKVRKVELS